jgi:hypothetical protein
MLDPHGEVIVSGLNHGPFGPGGGDCGAGWSESDTSTIAVKPSAVLHWKPWNIIRH